MKEPDIVLNIVIGYAVVVLYYVPLEGMFGVTLGKLVTGTRVVDEQGRPPSWGQVLGRTFARFIPFEAFSVLFAREDRVSGWHDRLPKTLVVRIR
ncbi:RDD family protein [Lysobacter capsici]